MDSRKFYDYIMDNFNLGGTASRLVHNIIEYVKDQEFIDAKDAQAHLKSLLNGAFGIEEREIKLYRADECKKCGGDAPYGLEDCDGVMMNRIEVDTVFGKLYAEKSSDPSFPGIYIGLEREDVDRTTDMTLALAECTPDIPVKGGYALRVLVWKIYFDDYDKVFTFIEQKPDVEDENEDGECYEGDNTIVAKTNQKPRNGE